jgi:hypothetical protein
MFSRKNLRSQPHWKRSEHDRRNRLQDIHTGELMFIAVSKAGHFLDGYFFVSAFKEQ